VSRLRFYMYTERAATDAICFVLTMLDETDA